MNSFIVSATIVEAPQARTAGEEQKVAEAWVEVLPFGEEKTAKFRVFAWNGLSDRLMERAVGDRVLLQGALGMRTVERPEGYKEKLAEMTLSNFQIISVEGGEATTGEVGQPDEATVTTKIIETEAEVAVTEGKDTTKPKKTGRKKAA